MPPMIPEASAMAKWVREEEQLHRLSRLQASSSV